VVGLGSRPAGTTPAFGFADKVKERDMSVTDPNATRTGTEVRGRATDSFIRREVRETKPSFMTTEFWAMIIGVAALIVVYNAASNASLTLWRTCVLATAIAVAYIVSRGFAKSGSRDDHWRGDA
jgi:hypothetical protein